MNAPAKNITGGKPAFSKERACETKKAIGRFGTHLAKGGEGLWDHQSKAMASVGTFLRGSLDSISRGECVSGAIVMPTGAGKTVVAAEITRGLETKALILAPTLKIVQQHKEELAERVPALDAAIYRSQKGLGSEVVVMTYQAAVSLLKKGALPDDFGVVFYDEAHRSLSTERSRLHGSISQIEIGLTATPVYDEAKHIWTVFDRRIFHMGLEEGVESGVLSPLRGYVVPTHIDVRNVRLKLGEDSIDGAKAEKFLNVYARNLAAKRFYLERFRGTPAVVFCVSKIHAEHFADYMRASGVKAAHIHGGMGMEKREEVLRAFEKGELDMLTSVDVLIEGWDSKRVILAINLRPTYSKVVKAHMVGRVLRKRPGKEAGIFVEFQDMYAHGQQPILVHHLLERDMFRQGGLVVAPARKMASEEKKLTEGKLVSIMGKINVSFEVKPVIRLERGEREYDLRNPKVLEEILDSRPDIDWEDTPPSKLRNVTFDHPAFTGNLMTLVHKVFGIPNRAGRNLNTAEDIRMFLWYAIERRMMAADDRKHELAASFADKTFSLNPVFGSGQSVPERKMLSEKMDRVLRTLTPREEKMLRLSFEEGMSLEEVAGEFGVPWGRAHQIGAKALRKLRHPTRSQYLREFTEKDPPQEFNPDHSHRYELVGKDGCRVTLEKAWHATGFMKPRVRLSAPLKKHLENALEILLGALQKARSWKEKDEILERAGFSHFSRQVSSSETVFGVLDDEFARLTHHRIRVEYTKAGTFRETGGDF